MHFVIVKFPPITVINPEQSCANRTYNSRATYYCYVIYFLTKQSILFMFREKYVYLYLLSVQSIILLIEAVDCVIIEKHLPYGNHFHISVCNCTLIPDLKNKLSWVLFTLSY